MKRLFSTLSTLSDETEPGIKRARRSDSSLSSSLETNESIHSSNRLEIHYSIDDVFFSNLLVKMNIMIMICLKVYMKIAIVHVNKLMKPLV
jgi:hypothetical protein